jgi:cytochrome c oxidase accessory protein FixG
MNNRIPLKEIDTTTNHIDMPIQYNVGEAIVNANNYNPAIRLASGLYQKLRRLINTPLILLFVLAPWLTINSAPILQMDLTSRQLHLLGINFWPDDLLILFWVALASAFALFATASFAGRLWCGFTCPQTVWSMMFIWVEEKIEGSRHHRLKQQSLPFMQRGLVRMMIKHSIWLILAFITGFTFVAFFETGPNLFHNIISGEIGAEIAFWLIFFTSLTYINAGWLREQVCLHMCPYARFQSVMLDSKSLKVSYDKKRGEPRTTFAKVLKRSHNVDTDAGACVDCELCIQVCPVGIDIRQGMQYACIDCGACIDACDEVMEKVNQPKGLIRFSNELNQHWTDLFKNRKSLIGYSLLTLISILGFVFQVSTMESFDGHLVRDRSQLFFYNNEGHMQNAFTLKIHNKTSTNQQYQLTLNNSELTFSEAKLDIKAGDKKTTSLIISCLSPCNIPMRSNIKLIINSSSGETKTLKSTFFSGS